MWQCIHVQQWKKANSTVISRWLAWLQGNWEGSWRQNTASSVTLWHRRISFRINSFTYLGSSMAFGIENWSRNHIWKLWSLTDFLLMLACRSINFEGKTLKMSILITPRTGPLKCVLWPWDAFEERGPETVISKGEIMLTRNVSTQTSTVFEELWLAMRQWGCCDERHTDLGPVRWLGG